MLKLTVTTLALCASFAIQADARTHPALSMAATLFAVENADEKYKEPEERKLDETTKSEDASNAAPTWMGISEEEFKALHQLRTDQVPTLHGAMVALAGGQAYLSLPEKAKAPLPAVLVIHEWWGLNDHVKHWADRLAADGYAALAVDLYGGQVATDADGAMSLMKSVQDSTSLRTLAAALQFLHEDPRIDANKIGSIGWCFGGGWSLRTALLSPELSACVIYYGRPVMDVEQLKTIHAEVLGVFGNLDSSIPPATVDQFEAALKQAGVKETVLRFNAVHAFANPSNPKYDEASAGAAWKEVRALLKRTLKS
ncbi:MAG: dienelactone hydrolase family protein [Candidatus Eisenbacteria bacterium]